MTTLRFRAHLPQKCFRRRCWYAPWLPLRRCPCRVPISEEVPGIRVYLYGLVRGFNVARHDLYLGDLTYRTEVQYIEQTGKHACSLQFWPHVAGSDLSGGLSDTLDIITRASGSSSVSLKIEIPLLATKSVGNGILP